MLPSPPSSGHCPDCHLNQDCYDYSKNFWSPSSGCPATRILDDGEVERCLRENSIVLVGDSR